MPLHELHIGKPHPVAVGVGQGQHLRRHIQPEHPAGRPHLLGCDKAVDAAAGTQVQDGLAGAQVGQRGRIAAAGRRGHSLNGQPLQLRFVVQRHSPRGVRRPAAGRRIRRRAVTTGLGIVAAVIAAAGAVAAVVGAAARVLGRGNVG